MANARAFRVAAIVLTLLACGKKTTTTGTKKAHALSSPVSWNPVSSFADAQVAAHEVGAGAPVPYELQGRKQGDGSDWTWEWRFRDDSFSALYRVGVDDQGNADAGKDEGTVDMSEIPSAFSIDDAGALAPNKFYLDKSIFATLHSGDDGPVWTYF